MAKKAKSKMNRRTKRIIRRSIAALLMVTAIGIAAIPAKEVSADTSNPAISAKRETIIANAQADPEYSGTPSYVSKTDKSLDLNLPNRAELSPTRDSEGKLVVSGGKVTVNGSQTDLLRTYAISDLSNGTPEIKWQFEFYDSTTLGCILARYNNEYRVDEVTLPINGAIDFAIV
ncbi:MAG: hypothetical protein IKY04_02705, partial [Lachnospiraceae bacterium]|nr:hypothetical protein [Lachnospiraceae bacterium]